MAEIESNEEPTPLWLACVGWLFAATITFLGVTIALHARNGIVDVVLGAAIASAAVGITCVLSIDKPWAEKLGGLLFLGGLYVVFTGIGISMVADPATTVAQDRPGGRGPDIDTEKQAVFWGLFFIAIVNIPAILSAGIWLSERNKKTTTPDTLPDDEDNP